MTVAELGHLQPPCREAALLPDAERVHWLRQERWIQYPRAERILDRLMDLVDYPPRDRMPCLVIYGATGMGKTRIIQKFLRDNRAHFDKKLGRTRLAFMRVYREEQDRQVIVGFTDGTELTIDFEVKSVTSAVLYQPTPGATVQLERFDEPPANEGPFSATIRASTRSLE